jgi:hypothetical protein
MIAFRNYAAGLQRRSRALVRFLDMRIELLINAWIAVVVLAGLAKVALAPGRVLTGYDALAMVLPYLLVALAPVAGYRVAAGSFPRGLISAQPAVRLARIGNWRDLTVL